MIFSLLFLSCSLFQGFKGQRRPTREKRGFVGLTGDSYEFEIFYCFDDDGYNCGLCKAKYYRSGI